MMASRLPLWLPRLLFPCVLGVLVLVGVIQYQWFSRSAAVEIETAIRGLESTVRQTLARESQRFGPLISELQNSTEPAPVVLDRLLATYGPAGPTPDLLAWVAWSDSPEGEWHRRVPGRPWEVEVPDPRHQDGQVLLLRNPNRRESFFLGIDQARFWLTYLQPALQETFPGASIGTRSVQVPEPPRRPGFDSRIYTFSPMAALVSGPSVSREIVMGMPHLADPRTKDGPFFVPYGKGNEIVVILPPEAPVLTIEARLAWNWLGSLLLLVLLGAAFLLVLRQSMTTAALRHREREFVASVSHELRTPLTVIRSAADNFIQGIVPAERQERYGRLILDQSLRLGRMIEEMLSFAQAEAGTQPPLVEALLDPVAWLAEVRPPLDALAQARGISLNWDTGALVPGVGDPEGLRLILENLTVNALNHAYDASSPGLVRITLRPLLPDRLELVVDDDGRGIAPPEVKRVFEPFYRDRVSRNRQETGSGLGLFLAQHRARIMGGTLTLESPWRRIDGTKRPGCRFRAVVRFKIQEVNHGR